MIKLKFIGLSYLLMLTVSCGVLEQEPQNEISEDIAITNQKGVEAAVAGMYNELQQDGEYYGRNIQIMGDLSADIAQSIGSWDHYREMDTYVVSTGNQENGLFWGRAYKAVNVANNIISSVSELGEIPEAARNNYLGQAYFIRALAIFDLTKVYGGAPGVIGSLGVPLVLQPSRQVDESLFPARASLQESYEQVENDLLTALDLLPDAQSSDVATRSQAVKGTARALLSRLYLYLDQPEQVIAYADQVIADPMYALEPNYLSIFEGDFTSESIFELNFNNTDQSGLRNWYVPSTIGGRGDLAAHTEFYEEITANPNDVRGQLFGYNEGLGIYYPTKYIKAGNIDNVHILRMGEIYLNRAEAKAKTGDIAGALADLNAVHTRAGLDALTTSGTEATLAAIWEERKLELAFEGHRFFDLVRTGQALTELTNIGRTNGPPVTLSDPGRQVFPIPNFDIDANSNLVQNEAYQ
ncbi:MAG: RagB/SusD family nutrient uptake outer membrane protein [Cyclobacteriaceae bacterium]